MLPLVSCGVRLASSQYLARIWSRPIISPGAVESFLRVKAPTGCLRIMLFSFFGPGDNAQCPAIRVIFGSMGSKDKGKKETKKAPKPKPKVEPGRKRGEDTRLGGPPKS